MIVFDQNVDEIYEVISWNFHSTYSISIKARLDMYPYISEWFCSYFDDSGMIKSIYKYKRTLYYLGKGNLRFDGCFIREYRITDNDIEVNLSVDYFSEVVGDISEIKKKYRDKKIDELLK